MKCNTGAGLSWDYKESFTSAGKKVTLYHAVEIESPLVVINNYSGDGSSIVQAMREVGCIDCNLLVVDDLVWNHDMTPWYCPPLYEDDVPCTGGAAQYLEALLSEIVPAACARVAGEPLYLGIAGYSLAGLFALYAAYRSHVFTRVASMSGSLWYPGLIEYVTTHGLERIPEKIYLSLGNREANARNQYIRIVQNNTEMLAAYFRTLGIDIVYELNPGNHSNNPALRIAKGIAAIVA